MTLSEAVQLLSRRLGVKASRASIIANRLQHAGHLPLADAKRSPPSLADDEVAMLLIAVLSDRGIGSAAARAAEYAATTSPEGYRFAETVLAVLRGEAQPGDLIVKDGGAAFTVNGAHVVFGSPADDGFARFATGPTLAAIAAELQGAPPASADAVAAIQKIRGI